MSRASTLEQKLLFETELFLSEHSNSYDERLAILEAVAAKTGHFEIEEYWKTFKICTDDQTEIKKKAETVLKKIQASGISVSLALSSLSREPLSISKKKENGVFYTDFRLAQFIAEDCRQTLMQDSDIADIAAGSGILLAAVADLYFKQFPHSYDQWISEHVYAFDLSKNALRGARIALATHATSVSSIKKMFENWKNCDSLFFDEKKLHEFDIVVGNPPWGKVKISRHCFVNKDKENTHIYGAEYQNFNQEEFRLEKEMLKNYGKKLRERFPLIGDGEPDMYMAFLQKAISVLKHGGHLSYIVPAGLIRSSGTKSLRNYLVECSESLKYNLLDNKSKFFEIDSRFKFLILSINKRSENVPSCLDLHFEIYKANTRNICGTEEIAYNIKELKSIRPDLTIPECTSNAEKELFVRLSKGKTNWKDEWGADISREIDMTNDSAKFHKECHKGEIPVIEGRMIQQFRFGAKAYVSGSGRSAKWIPSIGKIKPQFYINREEIRKKTLKRVDGVRAGYCDIAGQTNERAMTVAAIPAGVVCGNKVPTIIFSEDTEQTKLYFFIAVANSFVYDWFLRRVLSTTVNFFLLFSIPMPNIDFNSKLAKEIVRISKDLSCMENKTYYKNNEMGMLRARLDFLVAKAYGLNFADLELIMQDFPLLDRKQPAIRGEKKSTYTKDLLLSIAEKELNSKESLYTKRASDGLAGGARAYIPSEMAALYQGGII